MPSINDKIIDIFNHDASLSGSAPPDISAENELLLQIIQRCRLKCKIPRKRKHMQLSHQELFQLIEDVLSRRLNKKRARLFLDQFFYNPHFSAVFIPYIKIAAHKVNQHDPDLTKINMMPDELLVQKALSISAESSPISDPSQSRRRFSAIRIVKRPRFYVPAIGFSLMIILIISMSFMRNELSNETYIKYFKSPLIPFLDATVQAQQAPSNLRSFEAQVNSNSPVDWHHFYNLGLHCYIVKDYKASLYYFKEADAKMSRDTALKANEQSNFCFYYAMAHLGAADELIGRNRHLHRSIALFRKAIIYADAAEWPSSDAAHFFLGMAYDILGDEESAELVLRDIDPSKSFYDDVGLLLDEKK